MVEKIRRFAGQFKKRFLKPAAKKGKKRINHMDNERFGHENDLFVDEDMNVNNDASDTVSDDADDLIKHIDDFKKKIEEEPRKRLKRKL